MSFKKYFTEGDKDKTSSDKLEKIIGEAVKDFVNVLGKQIDNLIKDIKNSYSPVTSKLQITMANNLDRDEITQELHNSIEDYLIGKMRTTGLLEDATTLNTKDVGINDPEKLSPEKLKAMNLGEIAGIVRKDWKNLSYSAKPYLSAMFELDKISDKYGMDSGASIVAYFLSNAQQWKGETAKLVKLELNKRLKGK